MEASRRCGYVRRMATEEEAGRRIKAAREALHLTLREVCAAVPGLHVSTLSNWEQGIRMIGVDEARRLAPVLKVTPGYLLTIDDTTPTPREQALLDLYRATDTRGQDVIISVAEKESSYVVEPESHDDKAA